MAKRITKAESAGLLLLIVIAVPIYIVVQFFETFGTGGALGIIFVAIAAFFGLQVLEKQRKEESARKRKEALLSKYQDSKIVERIIEKTVWTGETAEQLVESLGKPHDVDEKVLKTKRKQIWKYAHRGGNRYGLRVILEDEVVVGWDEKLG